MGSSHQWLLIPRPASAPRDLAARLSVAQAVPVPSEPPQPHQDRERLAEPTPGVMTAQPVCRCRRCDLDGPHVPACAVHEQPPEPCGCRGLRRA